ncbi:V-type ATP synthase subunit F [Oxobacter pfennigii]|uniref:V-type ATP synthase subunit F n=1 Tax=Oxobacter pfennigii TaxID=36849 RepID=A0A0P8X5T4_9CLOT|nr:V-type ATP synthase subunit F [Oxobacter pfennigii]KPU46249.1 V-type ATP synthase subunit F [Oxobacter pfennigii]
MKAYLLSDNIDTQVGMRLVGIKGSIIHGREEVLKELNRVLNEKDIGIILITEKLSALINDEIKKIKLNTRTPLIVEIPDRHGTKRAKDSITRHVKESIGLKI